MNVSRIQLVTLLAVTPQWGPSLLHLCLQPHTSTTALTILYFSYSYYVCLCGSVANVFSVTNVLVTF